MGSWLVKHSITALATTPIAVIRTVPPPTRKRPAAAASKAAKSKTANWLAAGVDSNGLWPANDYRASETPSYYSHVAWPMLEVWKSTQNISQRTAAERFLNTALTRKLSNGAIARWGFDDQGYAFTHTIAYTIRGFQESSRLLNNYSKYGKPMEEILEFFVKKSELNKLRSDGFVPGILYGDIEKNISLSIKKTTLDHFLKTTNFKSKVIKISIEGKEFEVLPRDVEFDNLSNQPIHVDFQKLSANTKVVVWIPVKFLNEETCPGLKMGGVLNIVRRKVELKCPSEKIPENLTIDLDGVDIGESFKISSIKLDENVTPTIQGRDFVIATLAAPTVMKEPEKPAEAETAEGEEGAEGTAAAAADGDKAAPEAAKGEKKEGDEKKPTDKKPTEEKK